MAPMAPKVRLVLGVHSHQPLGNFDDVIERALKQAYDPFLDALDRHPGVRTVLHYSGCLYEWLEVHAPRHLDRVASLADAGRIEILSGGYYEPILPLIPRTDRVGQIRLLSRYIQARFGQTPRGMWLAERVWEPTLPATLREAGIDYTLLDDFHFLTSLDGDPVGGHYVTEDQGQVVKLFPISEKLRYLIPFREPAETIAWLRDLSERTPAGLEAVAVMVDDGEKYGLWPGTHAWVHGEAGRAGWLERFFTALEENSTWISTTTPSEVMAAVEPRGRVYLPPASYVEMGEWSLPTARGRAFAAAVSRAKDRETWADEKPFLRGGYFRNFQSRYPESLMMLRRAQMLSKQMDESTAQAAADRDGLPGAPRRELWRSMCNCSYWHGIFGGLYLPHLRRAVGEHLCRARRLLEVERHGPAAALPAARLVDADADGHDEIEIRSAELDLLVEPARGGAITVLDLVLKDFPLGLTLTRRVEFYHEEMLHSPADGVSGDRSDAGGEHASIHDLAAQATDELKRLAVADDRQRASAVDRFLDPAERAEGSRFDPPGEVGDFYNARYEASMLPAGESAGAVLRRKGTAAGCEVRLTKTIRVGPPAGRLELAHTIEPGAKDAASAGAMFALEFNLGLIESMGRVRVGAGVDEGAGRSLSQPWASKPTGRLRVEDDHAGFALNFMVEPEAEVWHYPVRTVSRSEQGYEAIYQGSALLLVWPGLGSMPGRTRVVIDIEYTP